MLLEDRKIPMNSLNGLLINLSDFTPVKDFLLEININYTEIEDSKTMVGSLEIISNEPRKIDGYVLKDLEKFPKKFIDKFLESNRDKLNIKNLKTHLII